MNGSTHEVTPPKGAVTVSLKDLESGSVNFETLEEAFGPTSLGIIIVKDVPARFSTLRQKLFGTFLARDNAGIAYTDTLSEFLTSPQAKYLVGWSHGKESLRPGVKDTLKGSYYVNCAFYQDSSLSGPPAASFPDLPEYTAPNIWPPEDLLPGFRATFEELCTLIIDTAVLVARACDHYAQDHIPDYEKGYLERVVRTSFTTKARLLHYFPPPLESGGQPEAPNANGGEPVADDSWCATHLDHGCLTGLTSALYVDESKPLPSLVSDPSEDGSAGVPPLQYLTVSPDPTAGLYIRSRTGSTTKVSIPADCLAFQTGESLEKITRGRFKAVPHYVRSGSAKDGMNGIARNTLAVFTQPNLGEIVDPEGGHTFAEFARGVVGKNTVT